MERILRERLRIAAVVALLLLLTTTASVQEIDLAMHSVVRISGLLDGASMHGSGFVVGLDGDEATIVTAAHVIEGLQQVEVTFAAAPARSFPYVDVHMEGGSARGLAMFRVRGVPAAVSALSFEADAELQRGEDLLLLGFPQMATAPLTLRRTYAGPDGNFLQLDQAVGEGFSGGPVLRNGKVVGVVMGENPQLTFAVKAVLAQTAVRGWGGTLGRPSRTQPQVQVASCVSGEERVEKGITYVHICGGTFTMGSAANDPQASNGEKPSHPVTLSEFWLGRTEVTNDQYRRFRPASQGEGSLPVGNIVWEDAREACAFFGGRLPTEAEWEYAARGGSSSAWSFGNDEKPIGEYAWYGTNADGKLHAVGTKKPNRWNLYDMHGNALEWVNDWYGEYPGSAQTNPAGPATGEFRVLRGGSFVNAKPRLLRCAYRFSRAPTDRLGGIGFRCAWDSRRRQK